MTHVLVLSDLWPPFPGGAERLMFNIARHLHRQDGITVQVATDYARAKQHDGPPVWRGSVGVHDHRDEGAGLITAWIQEDKPDVIVTHHLFAFQFEPELEASGVPVVQLVLNGHRLHFARLAVYISEWVRQQVGGDEPQDLVMTPPAGPDTVADTHGDAIGFIKPIPHKGVDLVYQIARLMPRRRFVILRGEWQTLETIERLPNVEFMEPVDDIRDFYRECRMVLMPSVSEDAGTVPQECAANSIPCVSSTAGGLTETNGGGVLVGKGTARAWIQQINLLDQSSRYQRVVERQHRHLRALDHQGKLEAITEAVRRMGG